MPDPPTPASRSARRFVIHGKLALMFLGVFLPLVLFGKLARDVLKEGGLGRDAAWLESLHRHASPSRDALMTGLTLLGGPPVMAALGAAVALALFFKGRRRDAAFYALAVGGATVLNLLVKSLFRRDRPNLWETLVTEGSFSFPSGHAMGTMAAYAAGAFLLRDSRMRALYLLLGGPLVLGVGASRLYLGVHFPSDVLAGWCAALAWVVGVSRLRAFLPKEPASSPGVG